MILARLQSAALMVLAVLLVLLGVYAYGGRAARLAADKRRDHENALRAAAGARGVHDAHLETNSLPEGGAADRLRRDWVRDAGEN